jgi:hypothetical protein
MPGYTLPAIFAFLGPLIMQHPPITVESMLCRSLTVWPVVGLLLCLFLSGCVERRMTIRSNPPGALVYVDDHPDPIGVTPVSHEFIYYGTRKIRLVKDGYETLTVMQPVPTPWYEYVPLDLISETFVPGQIRDQRLLEYQLKPQMVMPADQLLARAEELRRGAHAAAAVPTVAAPGQVVPAPQGVGGRPVRPLPTSP